MTKTRMPPTTTEYVSPPVQAGWAFQEKGQEWLGEAKRRDWAINVRSNWEAVAVGSAGQETASQAAQGLCFSLPFLLGRATSGHWASLPLRWPREHHVSVCLRVEEKGATAMATATGGSMCLLSSVGPKSRGLGRDLWGTWEWVSAWALPKAGQGPCLPHSPRERSVPSLASACLFLSPAALCDMHPMRALFLIPRNPPPKLKSKKWYVGSVLCPQMNKGFVVLRGRSV